MTAAAQQNRTLWGGVAMIVAVTAAITVVLVLGRGSAGLDDGLHTVRLVSRDAVASAVELDEVTLLTGAPAREAAIADGRLDPEEDLPNDYYLQNSEESIVAMELATNAELTVIHCNGGCQPTPADLNAFLAGQVAPFNGPTAIFETTVDRGRIVAIHEIYLP